VISIIVSSATLKDTLAKKNNDILTPGISSVVITNKTVLFTCLLQFKLNMGVKFHLCLLLIILGAMAANVALARKSVTKESRAYAALAGKYSIYTPSVSRKSRAHLCVECRPRKKWSATRSI